MTVRAERPPLGRARPAIYGLFVSFGILLSTWAVHLPSLKHQVGMSTSMMGTMLLLLGVGAIAGMQLTGILVDRFRSETMAVVGAVAMALVLSVPLAAHSLTPALSGALLFGVTAGVADVAMNAASVDLQRDYGRPIVASFHGTFSVGTVIGSLCGAGSFAIGLGSVAAASSIGAVCLIIVAGSAVGLRGRHRAAPSRQASPVEGPTAWSHHRKVLVLGALAFFLLLCEGSAMDWASLHAQQRLGASASTGALTVASFLAAMMVSRFSIDRVTGRIGAVRVLRIGSLVATAGMLIVIASTSMALLVCGWIVFGLGLAVGVPQVFTAAGNLSHGRSGRNLSRVVGVGYVAILAGPAITGWSIELVSWTGAFLVPLAAVLACAAGASAVGPRAQRPHATISDRV